MRFKLCVRKRAAEYVKLAVLVGGGVIIATLLMIFLYAAPTGRIYKHAGESVPLYTTQMLNDWSGNTAYTGLSNFTESIMLNNALYRPYDSSTKNAMLNSYVYYEEEGMVGSLVRFLADGPTGGKTVDYSRYWHGYLVYLIPGLVFFTVGELKVLMMVVQMLLFSLCLYEFGKRDFLYAVLFTAVVLFINPVTTVLTFQDADIYIIMMLFTYLFLKEREWVKQKERWKYLFALNGMLTAFMDFFTYPLVAIGIPLLAFLIVEELHWKKGMVVVGKSLFFWMSGYAGMWIGKWVMTWLLTGYNAIAEGMDSVKYRTTGTYSDVELTYGYVLKCIWDAINEPPMWIMLILPLVVAGGYIWRERYAISLNGEKAFSLIPVFVVALLPFIYYFMVRNHTAIHPWLEYRELAVTLFGLGTLGIKMVCRKETDKYTVIDK